jgi:hypothetical protein
VMFRSQLEQKVASFLSEVGFEYEAVQLPYTLECKYKPDFLLPNGIFLEVKGYLDVADKRKMRAVKRHHPELDIRFVFQSPHKIIPGSKQTHAQWADKHGFPWCHYQAIPPKWLTKRPPQPPTPSSPTTSVQMETSVMSDSATS